MARVLFGIWGWVRSTLWYTLSKHFAAVTADTRGDVRGDQRGELRARKCPR